MHEVTTLRCFVSARFEFLMAFTIKITSFWDGTPYSLVSSKHCLERNFCTVLLCGWKQQAPPKHL
jgi:hypothetical protein